MSNGIFITGTDTGVGKTFVAAGMIQAMKKMGINVCPMKPVETGSPMRRGKLIPDDTVKLMKASGVNEPIDFINPYRLKHPLAPSVAAEIEGVKISGKKIISTYHSLSKKYDITVVEGAGGIMVPVYKKYLFLDLARDMKLPVVIVSRPGLGTINHTLLTIEAAKNRGVDVLGVIINYSIKTRKGLSEKTNPEVIRNLARVPVLGIIPFTKHPYTYRLQKEFGGIVRKILSYHNERTNI
jgi:dethiobiotin synthetase